MILTDLTLQNFRSYDKKKFTFSPKTTLILGPNTAGKTNILEALMLLAVGRSFRADQDREMISWGRELARVGAEVSHEDEKTKLEIVVTRGEMHGQKVPLKKYLVNGVARRQIDFVGHLRAVLFWPEDLELVTDSPSLRRRYLDSVMVQVDREYRRNLLSYERALQQRNKLLDFVSEGKAHRHQLAFWNQLLIAAGGYITDMRGRYLEFVNRQRVPNVIYFARYDKSVISETRLEQYKEEEIAAKATLVGPHRDDVIVEEIRTEGAIDIARYGSRGEQRLAVLWLKLAELAYIEQESRQRPVLLLDDIFSELDSAHRTLVLAEAGQQQTIITSADPAIIHEGGMKIDSLIRL